jgi:hypothetical protein
VDEITLFEELQPPPPPDAPRMREAARARLTVATSTQLVHPSGRRSTVMTVAAAAALAAGGAGYGLTALHHGSSPRPAKAASTSLTPPVRTVAGLTSVNGCPGQYLTAGTLEQVDSTELTIQPANDTDHVNRVWQAAPVRVATAASTLIWTPVAGTLGDITDGTQVMVQGNWSGQSLAATQVEIRAKGLPPQGSFGPQPPVNRNDVRVLKPQGSPGPPLTQGTVQDVHDGGFTVVSQNPLLGQRRIQVITSTSTSVLTNAGTSLSQLTVGANVVAVGPIGHDGVMAASAVAEPAGPGVLLAGGPVKVRSSSCSASAITTAAILAGA